METKKLFSDYSQFDGSFSKRIRIPFSFQKEYFFSTTYYPLCKTVLFSDYSWVNNQVVKVSSPTSMVYTKIQIKRMISIVVLLYCSCLVFAAVSSTMYNYPTYSYMDNQFESLSKAFNEMNIDPIHSYYKVLGYSYRRNPISVLCFGSCKDEQTPSVFCTQRVLSLGLFCWRHSR